MSNPTRVVPNTEEDQQWADLLSPTRRSLITAAGLTTMGVLAGNVLAVGEDPAASGGLSFTPIVPARDEGKSPWGYETYKEAPTQPKSVRPREAAGIPKLPRPYTDIKSYHAHFYFDDDTYEKAAVVRQWSIERFPVELGNWNLEPRGPHVTPSFYFGFTNDLLPILVPWLQLNSLGLTVLLHPNTDDPRADHLYYTLWVNRSQPVNAYGLKAVGQEGGPKQFEKILPNIKPTVKLEV